MFPIEGDVDPSVFKRVGRHSPGAIVASEVSDLMTHEGRSKRLSDKDAETLARSAGAAVGGASGLEPAGKGLVAWATRSVVKPVIKKLPEPLIVIISVIGIQGGIALCAIYANEISAKMDAELNALKALLESVLR